MAVISSKLDFILRRMRKWHEDNLMDNFLVPRRDVETLLEGIDELKTLARAAPAQSQE